MIKKGHDQEQNLTICPRCHKHIDAKKYLDNPAMIGLLDSILPVITCDCGYSGPAITVSVMEYARLRGNAQGEASKPHTEPHTKEI